MHDQDLHWQANHSDFKLPERNVRLGLLHISEIQGQHQSEDESNELIDDFKLEAQA